MLHTLIRHGMQEPKKMCQFMLAIEEEKAEAKQSYKPCVEEVEKLRSAALEARLNLKWALKITKTLCSGQMVV